jgi:preprotein translocase subunit Sec61beta
MQLSQGGRGVLRPTNPLERPHFADAVPRHSAPTPARTNVSHPQPATTRTRNAAGKSSAAGFWSFFHRHPPGRRDAARRRDDQSPHQVIVVGILFAAVLVAGC